MRANSSGAAGVAPSLKVAAAPPGARSEFAGAQGTHRVRRIEFGVWLASDLLRRSSGTEAWPGAVTGVKTGSQADEGIALWRFGRRRETVRHGTLRIAFGLDFVDRGIVAGIASEQAHLDERKRRPVRLHSLLSACERNRLSDWIAVREQPVAVIDPRQLDWLLLGLGRDRQQHADGEAPRSDDRSGPSYARATHSPSTRPSCAQMQRIPFVCD